MLFGLAQYGKDFSSFGLVLGFNMLKVMESVVTVKT